MSEITIQGNRPLDGEIKIQGSKNGVLPMLAASILQKGTVKLTNVPIIQDVICMVGILESAGCRCKWDEHSLYVDASAVCREEIPREDVGKMRSSILLMGALLGRMGKAVTWQPGGCSIGSRPVDLHLFAFSSLGAEVKEEDGRIEAFVKNLTGNVISFPFPSVGATENALLASVLAKGKTVICRAAREPEIISLCCLLNQMGADIQGGGTEQIVVNGVDALRETEFCVPGDRIAAGTYMTAAVASRGHIRILDAPWEFMQEEIRVFREAGAAVSPIIQKEGRIEGIEVSIKERPRALQIFTSPYPGFPTDLQSPMLSVLAGAKGVSRLKETVFEARFKTAQELKKMGADIQISDNEALITGKPCLFGAKVRAWDLRGGAALVTAALGAEGETRICDCIHIERGYEDICRDIRLLKGDMKIQH